MNDKEPTKAQEQAFWKRCGFELWQGSLYWYPDKTGAKRLPELYGREALGNLFKHAVPVLISKGWSISITYDMFEKVWRVEVFNDTTEKYIERQGTQLEDEVFWAIWEAFNDK